MIMGELNLELAIKRRPEPQRSVQDILSKMQSISSLQVGGLTEPVRNSQSFEMIILQTPKDCRIAGKAETDKRMSWSSTSTSLVLTSQQQKPPNGLSTLLRWSSSSCMMATRRGELPGLSPPNSADGDNRSYLHSPFWFCSAALEPTSEAAASTSSALAGCLVSSLHKVKLQDNMG